MVGLSWVKAHVGIPGNELADQQAKLAVTSGEKFVIPAPYSHFKGLLKNYIVNEWNEYWNSYDSASGIRVRGYINQTLHTVSAECWVMQIIISSPVPSPEFHLIKPADEHKKAWFNNLLTNRQAVTKMEGAFRTSRNICDTLTQERDHN
ncbi:hypothetical protein AVEN_66411-1 [Araneus ventricosus]|uniref:RNase H type-1 domain-containing protein n=1 Tax=Araneus ventricosus TaxID=182803 RepID=A0A4Y2EGB4_ARAVE|nr:hypothetical protein AVEN_66411-1 [Araneus ventricosus]